MRALVVRPGAEEIASGRVACWDQNEAHFAVNAAWREFGGAHIVGDPYYPDVTYTVAPTVGVEDAIRKGRLVMVETIDVPEQIVAVEVAQINRKPPAASNEARGAVLSSVEQTGGEADSGGEEGQGTDDTPPESGRRRR